MTHKQRCAMIWSTEMGSAQVFDAFSSYKHKRSTESAQNLLAAFQAVGRSVSDAILILTATDETDA